MEATSEASLSERHFGGLLFRFKKAQGYEDKRAFVQAITSEFSPWEMAHYLMLAADEEGANVFRIFLYQEHPATAFRVDTLLNASQWRDPFNEGIARDFGSQ